MISQSLEEILKKAKKNATDTNPEAYRDRVLSAARQAMKASRKDSIEIDHKKGNVIFSLDRDADRIRMFVNGEEIPEDRMTATIANLDGIGSAETITSKAQKAIEASGITRNIGSRSFDAVLRAASNDAKEASRSTGSLLRALLMMMSRSIDAR